MARPLPKTNAPASVKYQAIRQSVSCVAGPERPVKRIGGASGIPRATDPLGSRRDRTSTARIPAPRKTQTISDSVQAVTSAATANSPHRSASLPSVSRVSLKAPRAMIGDHGGADPVERALHPRQPAVADVGDGKR